MFLLSLCGEHCTDSTLFSAELEYRPDHFERGYLPDVDVREPGVRDKLLREIPGAFFWSCCGENNDGDECIVQAHGDDQEEFAY